LNKVGVFIAMGNCLQPSENTHHLFPYSYMG
jgi:hypothetical protein